MQFTAVITACSMDDHNEEKRTEFICTSGKSEAELALDVLYY